MANFDFLHIKRHTAGSSNELSFDVLDAARDELDSRQNGRSSGRSSRSSRSSGKGSRGGSRSDSRSIAIPRGSGTFRGLRQTTKMAAAPEVMRRKQVRRARSARLWIIALAIIAVFAGIGAYAGYRFYQEKVDFTGHFGALIDRFTEIDQSLVEIDELMRNPLNYVEIEQREKALAGIPAMRSDLRELQTEAEEMMQDANGNEDVAALNEIDNAVAAREGMLDAATDAFKLSESVSSQVKAANEAWSAILAADQAAREATEQANAAATEGETAAARDKTSDAIGQLTAARQTLDEVEVAVQGVNYTAVKAYVDKRIEALESAVRTSNALLAIDRDGAIAANDEYNRLDKEAAGLAKRLPTDLGNAVTTLYEGRMQTYQNDYTAARAQASKADADLRTYTTPH